MADDRTPLPSPTPTVSGRCARSASITGPDGSPTRSSSSGWTARTRRGRARKLEALTRDLPALRRRDRPAKKRRWLVSVVSGSDDGGSRPSTRRARPHMAAATSTCDTQFLWRDDGDADAIMGGSDIWVPRTRSSSRGSRSWAGTTTASPGRLGAADRAGSYGGITFPGKQQAQGLRLPHRRPI